MSHDWSQLKEEFMKCMDKKASSFLFSFKKEAEGRGISAISSLLLAAGGSSIRKNPRHSQRLPFTHSHEHTPYTQSTLTHSTECRQNAALFHAEISCCACACACACVCMRVWQAVSLSTPSAVIKARTNHPERSPFFIHSLHNPLSLR